MERKVGARYLGNNSCSFTVWAPFAEEVQVLLKDQDELVSLHRDEHGYWEGEVSNVKPGSYYKYRLNDEEDYPDPASRSQPEGVHSWSQVVDPDAHRWNDNSWKGIPTSEMIIYEIHTGTFTKKGTFLGIEEKLDHLLELGINCIEIMPISQFPGSRNWGYDGVYPYAVQDSYGGVAALKQLVDSCHRRGIAVLLDVVYNHMGPEGNYISAFGPYFTDHYHTPWGKAINFDGPDSDEVRNYFLQNALMWLEEFHFDGLRLDAVHEIIDLGARHFLKELSEKTDALETKTGRNYEIIAESDRNDVRMVSDYDKGGYGLEAQWVDDFHHSLHTVLTGESKGYYEDYGKLWHLAKSFKQGFVYDGIYSEHRKKTVGNDPEAMPPEKFVVSTQNHDQVGNRMLGERLPRLVSFEELKMAAAIMLISPYVPMLFMGEEFAEDRPFQYFVSHGDEKLVKAVQEGRKREFKYFLHEEGAFPDPQSEETFEHSKINWNFSRSKKKAAMFSFYKHLISLRKEGRFSAFRSKKIRVEPDEDKKLLLIFAEAETKLLAAFNFGKENLEIQLPEQEDNWKLLVASEDKKWLGAEGLPQTFQAGQSFDLVPVSFIIFES